MALVLLLLFVCLMELSFASGSTASIVGRKVWSECHPNGSCSCGSDVGAAVVCKEDSELIYIQPCFCMYYDSEENKTLLRNCLITCFHFTIYGNLYNSIKRYPVENAALFNEAVCSESSTNIISNRFCGRCKEGYGLAVYSYHYTSCTPCTDYSYKNWLLYFTVALLPLTIFYFLVVTLKFNVAGSGLNGTIFVLQCLMSSAQLRLFEGFISASTRSSGLFGYVIVTSLLGFVNLDFFRTAYPYFCLHPKLNILHIMSLEFIVALYPFLLIFLTYILITMQSSDRVDMETLPMVPEPLPKATQCENISGRDLCHFHPTVQY